MIPAAAIDEPGRGDRRRSGRAMRSGNWPRRGEVVGQAGRRVEAGVRGTGRREQRRDGHQPVAGLAEHGLGRDRDRRRPGRDDLGHRQRPEHADARRRCRSPSAIPIAIAIARGSWCDRVGEVLRGEGDDAEAEEGEERQRDAGHDVADARIRRTARAAPGRCSRSSRPRTRRGSRRRRTRPGSGRGRRTWSRRR